MSSTVVHCLSNRWNSAITEFALSAMQALRSERVQQILVCGEGTPAVERAKRLGFDVVTIPRFSLVHLYQFRSLLHETMPAQVFLYGGPESFLLRCALLIGQRALGQGVQIVRFRGSVPTWRQMVLDQISPVSFKLMTPCKAIKGRRATTVTLGLDVEAFKFVPSSACFEEPSMLIFGRLDPVKGHEDFIRLFGEMLRRFPSERIRLDIVGQEANVSVQELKNFAEKVGVLERVCFRSERVAKVPQLLHQATLGVIPSLASETICRVAQEFLLCGTPVLVSGVGGLEEVLFTDAGESYRLWPPEERVTRLRSCFVGAREEGALKRQSRAQKAAELFGLERMRGSLCALLAPDKA